MTHFEKWLSEKTFDAFIDELVDDCAEKGLAEWCPMWKSGPKNRVCGEECYLAKEDRKKCRPALVEWANKECEEDEQ